MTPELERAYAACRKIARQEAKNFYYAFLALPREKRNAICAVYAFMRRADDLSDDESVARSARRAALEQWLAGWRRALDAGAAADPVFLALLDAQRRFAIPPSLLEELVQGTAMDLMDATDLPDPMSPDSSPSAAPAAAPLVTYATFSDLYRYCYLVASVVGLVCIRIFGYSDPRAEKLAEETGVAFQLTNILRDVREDAQRGRLYLPLKDLEGAGASPQEFVRAAAGGASQGREDRGGEDQGGEGQRREKQEAEGGRLTAAARAVLRVEAQRAQAFYRSAEALLPLVSSDSRPALWVLVTIYRRLLQRIERRDYDVFSAKITVPAYEKLAVLGCGILKTLLR